MLPVLLPGMIGGATGGPQGEPSDSQLRAAFLFRFGQYASWPKGSDGASATAPFVIGVFADPALLKEMARLVAGRMIEGRTVSVRAVDQVEDQEGLAVLFLGTDDPLLIGRAIRVARARGILTVGYTDGFAERGGMINFFHEDAKLRFEVNVDATANAGLRLSSQLLRLARLVKSQGGEP
ncbi:MAG: YfiR family protein [Gemmatimonadaceae bacterium]|nr:YfiR family protein [Gemmatimonadaceae bacterium]